MEPKELDRLVFAYLDGDITEQEAKLLSAIIRQGGEDSDRCLERLRLEGALHQAIHPVPVSQSAIVPSSHGERRMREISFRSKTRGAWPRWSLAAAGAVAIASVLIWMTPHRSPKDPSGPGLRPGDSAREEPSSPKKKPPQLPRQVASNEPVSPSPRPPLHEAPIPIPPKDDPKEAEYRDPIQEPPENVPSPKHETGVPIEEPKRQAEKEPEKPTEVVPPALRIVAIRGTLELSTDGSPSGRQRILPEHATPETPFRWQNGGSIRVRQGPAQLVFDGCIVDLNRRTQIRLLETVPTILELMQGEAFFTVDPGRAIPLRISTDEGSITVTGTKFGVSRENGKTGLAVTRGSVRCENRSGSVDVPSGFGCKFGSWEEIRPTRMDDPFTWRYPLYPEKILLWEYDFEGDLPDVWKEGRLEEDPGRASRGRVLRGVRGDGKTGEMVRLVRRNQPSVFVYSEGLILSFDYWVGGEVSKISVQSFNQSTGVNHARSIQVVERERWGHAVVAISDLLSRGDKQEPKEEEVFTNIAIWGGRQGEGSFHVDNVRLESYRADRIPETSK